MAARLAPGEGEVVPMLANGTVHTDPYRWWLTIRRPTRLIRADRARAIDRIIDYFGEGSGRPAPVSLTGAARADLSPASSARAVR
jgi:hypothetical protein